MLISIVVTLAILGADAVLNTVENTDVAAERKNLNSIKYNVDLYSQTQAREDFVGKESSHGALNWTCPVKKSDDLSNSWYRYLNSLYCEFSKYEIQVAKKSYNVANIDDWGRIHVPNLDVWPIYDEEVWKSNEGEGIVIDESNFKRFLQKTKEYDIAEQDNIGNTEITEMQFNELNHVLGITIKDKMDISCKDSYMFITGNNILFSHIILDIFADTMDESCGDFFNSDETKYMNIFALNTIFIDDEIENTLNMIENTFNIITIIAPKWEIIGKRIINLNGQGATGFKAINFSYNRKDGRPGNDGKSGRNFFGIGEEFIGGDDLTISAKGGRGSRGEDGKNGTNGRDGESPPKSKSSYTCYDLTLNSGEVCKFLKCEKVKCEKDPNYDRFRIDCIYRIYGEKGKNGENAGNGGNGGKGGSPGHIVLFELNGDSGIRKYMNSGSIGLGGKGGIGGMGGKRGYDIEVECEHTIRYGEHLYIGKTYPSNERATPGKNGTRGKIMLARTNAIPMSNLYKTKTINQYKTFLRANLNDPFRNHFLMKFLHRLENNTGVKNVSSILGFIDELKSLELQYHKSYNYLNFLPFYKSLLDRISEYALGVNYRDDKKILAYLYTATLGRTHNLEDDLESNLIIDIASYLISVKKDIEKLNQLKVKKAQKEITNDYKQKYKEEIDRKINDANDLISKEIIPEMYKIEINIDNQIENLTKEVIKLQKETRVNVTKLIEKQNHLNNELILQGIFGALKILGTVVSFMGPAGAVAGSVIEIGSSLAETALLDLPNGADNAAKDLKQTATDVGNLKKKIDEFTDQKANELKKKLETVSEEVHNYPDILGEISVKVTDMQTRLTTIGLNKITIKEVQGFEMELKKTIQEQKDDLKNAVEGNEGADVQKSEKVIGVLDHLQKTLQLTSVVVDTFNKVKKRYGKVTEVENAINLNVDKFNKLKRYEDEIYDSMIPMIESMEKGLDDTIKNIKNKSKVALEVTRWKVKSTLNDMMLHLKKVTEEFSVSDSLARYINKLKEAMETLMNVQDYIQDYQRDQTLANFVAGVSSISVDHFDVKYNLMNRDDLRSALNDLDITITSSIVMQRHKVVIDAFKQYIFPFAHRYFKGLLLPSHLELDDRNKPQLGDLISRAIDHIEHIESKLKEYKDSITEEDQFCFSTGEFRSGLLSSHPFFTWRNKRYNETISKLLDGEEVILSASEKHNPFKDNYDAIKFNSIEFNFKANDEETQDEIDKILKAFQVTGTHLGDSHYRYENDLYLITTADLRLSYSYEKHDGKPSHQNKAYSKLKEGDFLLSPYATWKVKLDHLNMTKRYSFDDLEQFKYKVDFMIEGIGHYIKRDGEYCSELEVKKYYTPKNKRNSAAVFNAVDFVPLIAYDTRTRSRHEIIAEKVTVRLERDEAKNNSAPSDRGNKKADFSNWPSWFGLPNFLNFTRS